MQIFDVSAIFFRPSGDFELSAITSHRSNGGLFSGVPPGQGTWSEPQYLHSQRPVEADSEKICFVSLPDFGLFFD
jgi:hypothetical protein